MKHLIGLVLLGSVLVATATAQPAKPIQGALSTALIGGHDPLETAATGYGGRRGRSRSRYSDYDYEYDEYDDEYERRQAARRNRRRGGGGRGRRGGNGGNDDDDFGFPSAAFGAGFGGAFSGNGQSQGFGAGFAQSFGRGSQASGFGGGIARSSGRRRGGYDDDYDRPSGRGRGYRG